MFKQSACPQASGIQIPSQSCALCVPTNIRTLSNSPCGSARPFRGSRSAWPGSFPDRRQSAPFEANLPALVGLLAVWNNDFLGANTVAVLPYEQYLKRISPSVIVEGEIGNIGAGSEIHDTVGNEFRNLTTPEEARQFVAATGIDVLAPAVGNMHGLLKSMVQGKDVANAMESLRNAVMQVAQ
jgi:hypothetical protein